MINFRRNENLSIIVKADESTIKYGASLVLFVFALREIGAARTGAYYSTAPFIGALIGLMFLHEAWSVALLIAGALMGLGVWLHLTEPAEKT